MKSIKSKLVLYVGIFFMLFFVVEYYRNYKQISGKHERLAQQQVSLAVSFVTASRQYVAGTVRPLMDDLVDEGEFIPETMSSSFGARVIFEKARQQFPDYIIKFAAENPRNPANQAGPEELKMIKYFNDNPQEATWSGNILIGGKPFFASFHTMRMVTACLHCHGDPADAPASMLERYGSTAAFHLPVGNVVGLDTVAVPVDTVNQMLWSEAVTNFATFGVTLILLALALTVILKFVITGRLSRMAAHFADAGRQSAGTTIEPIQVEGQDEISSLSGSFNTLAGKINDSHRWLESQVAERTRELEEATEQLIQSEKLSALGELTAGVAHELNQPLNGIKITSQSLLRDIKKNRVEEKELEDDLTEIVSQVNKMAEIIDHMRVYARNTQGSPRDMIDVGTLLEGPFKLLNQQLKTQNIEVIKEFAPDLPKVACDPIRLEQVFMNLVANAKNSLNNCAKDHKRIEVRTSRSDNGQAVVVEVKDNGEGVPEHLRQKIFQPFFTTREPGKGTGLGLSVSHKIITEHQGKIELESKVGQGTTFKVTLPAAD